MNVPAPPLEINSNTSSFAERILFEHRPVVLILCLLVSIFLGLQASKIQLNASFEKAIPTQHPYLVNASRFQPDLQGLNNFVRIAVSTNGTIFDAAYLETLRRINDEVFLLPGVDRSYMKSLWMSSVRWTGLTEEGYEGGPVIPDSYDGSAAGVAQVRANIERSGEIGNLVAANKHSTILFVPLLERDPNTGVALDYGQLNRELEQIRAKYETDSIKLHITGFAKVTGDMIDGLQYLLLFFVVAILISTVLLYYYTRCLRSTLLVVGCSLLAVVWLLGVLHTLGHTLDPYSILVPFIIFAIGISHGAQKMNGIAQDIGRGIHKLMAARRTFRRLFLPGLTALLTDAAGFAVLMIIPIVAIRELSITASIGVMGLIFTNLILLPVLLSYFGVNQRAAERSIKSERAETNQDKRIQQMLWHGIVALMRRDNAAIVLGVAGLLAVVGLIIGGNLRIGDLDPGAPELRSDSRYNKDDAFITENYATGSDILVVIVRTPQNQCATYDTLRKVDALEWELRQLPGVGSTNSLAALSKSTATFMNEGYIKWYDIPGAQNVLNNIAALPSNLHSENCDALFLHVYLRDHKADTLQQVTNMVKSFAARYNTRDVQFLLGGGNGAIQSATNSVVRGANLPMRVMIYAVIIALCLITFRSWRAALCAVLPLALSAILCEALMATLRIGVKAATLPVIALGVGIGVDYALYVLSVTLAGLRQGMTLTQAYYRALLFTGKVVALAGLVLAVSVATWHFSPIKFQAEMGNLLAFMFIWNMLGALILLPALMVFIMRVEPPQASGKSEARANRFIAIGAILAALVAIMMIPAKTEAAEIDTGTAVNVRWDNTVKYSAGWRVEKPSDTLLDNPNTDDGDRNFRKRDLISNRIDLLSELDLTYKDFGARVSGAAWYDTVYHHLNENDSPGTVNSISVPFNEFTSATRKLHGDKAEILDAFVFGNGQLGSVPASFRAGKHTLLWGESLLLAANGISYAQAPLDAIKAVSVPNTPSKELFMPVGQVSGQVTPTPDLSFAAYYQYQWRKSRLPAAGSYFSTADLLDEGGERLFVNPPTAFFRGNDLQAKDSGQWGISTHYRAEALDTDFGLYYINFNEKVPQIYLQPGLGFNPALNKIGEYSLVYPEDIHLIGVSFSTNVGAANVAGELHVRRNTPLASTPQIATPGADNNNNPLYAVGNTIHAQVSMIYVLPESTLWPTASLSAEIGGQHLSSITKNPNAFLPTQQHTAWGFRAVFTPTYFQVIPNLDISVPVGLGYNPKGKAPIAGFNGGADKGGDITIGVTGEYEKTWSTSLRYTHYFGGEDFQTLRDRDFVTFSVQSTF